MKILFLGDVAGPSGCKAVQDYLPQIKKKNKIDFVIANGENASEAGVGITEKSAEDMFNAGVNVITSGNHIWDQKETIEHITKEKRLLRPENLIEGTPGKGFEIYNVLSGEKIAVLNLMGNIFMKKCEDVFRTAEKIFNKFKLKRDADFIVVDFHGEITSEKMAMGHYLDGKATLVIGTHTHVPTSDFRVLENGTAYQSDAGMCGDYNSVIGMNKENSLKKFFNNKEAKKHFPSLGEATLSGIIVDGDLNTGLAKSVKQLLFGGVLKEAN
jgi:metallophosphoesterase (TIGR00282 family)